MIEENKTLVRRFFAAIENGDFGVFDEIVAVDYDDHLAGQTRGRDVLKGYFAGLRAAFSDLRLPIVAMVAEADRVAVLNSVRGTHRGEFAGRSPRGNQVDVMAFQLYRTRRASSPSTGRLQTSRRSSGSWTHENLPFPARFPPA